MLCLFVLICQSLVGKMAKVGFQRIDIVCVEALCFFGRLFVSILSSEVHVFSASHFLFFETGFRHYEIRRA